MQTSQKHQDAGAIHGIYDQPVKPMDPYYRCEVFQILETNMCSDIGSQQKSSSFDTFKEQYFTLESSPATTAFFVSDSPPAVSVLSNQSPFLLQGSQSCLSDPHHYSPENYSGFPVSGCSVADDGFDIKHKVREMSLLDPESNNVGSCYCCYKSEGRQRNSIEKYNWNQLIKMMPKLDLKPVLLMCARALSEADISTATGMMDVLGHMVSVSGDPVQRLGAYMLEGLWARLEQSGSSIYKALKCKEPTSSELLSYMSILYQICPYWRFAYLSANVAIAQAAENEQRIHIIDFQVAQGSQWLPLIEDLSQRSGGPPFIHITGIDDSQSAHARGGGLHIVGQRLSKHAEKFNVSFEFNGAAMCGGEVDMDNLIVRPGEAIIVNFPYVLHHMPDESVSVQNHRDQLLRMVKSLSPKVITLVEQESNTNTSTFFTRFAETLDYYTAMFESIDVACPRDDKQRISAEQHCLARDIVNMIACEGFERVERHELFGKWRSRLTMAGFSLCPLSPAVTVAIQNLLEEYNENYRIEERDGALYLGWMNRAMATFSAWR